MLWWQILPTVVQSGKKGGRGGFPFLFHRMDSRSLIVVPNSLLQSPLFVGFSLNPEPFHSIQVFQGEWGRGIVAISFAPLKRRIPSCSARSFSRGRVFQLAG